MYCREGRPQEAEKDGGNFIGEVCAGVFFYPQKQQEADICEIIFIGREPPKIYCKFFVITSQRCLSYLSKVGGNKIEELPQQKNIA